MVKKTILAFAALLLFASISCAFYSDELQGIPGSYLKINMVDKATGAFLPGTLTVAIESQGKTSTYKINFTDQKHDVNLGMPAGNISATARITASATGYYDDPQQFVITSDQYWQSVNSASAPALGPDGRPANWGEKGGLTLADEKVPTDVITNPPPVKYIAEHTFTLEKNPNYKPPTGTSTPSSGGCCGTGAILLFALFGLAAFASKKKVID